MTSAVRFAVAAVVAGGAALALAGDGDGTPPAGAAPPASAPGAASRECRIEVVAKGTGREAKKGDTALVHLSVKLAATDRVLMDTRLEGEPQEFPVGSGGLPTALEDTIQKMRVGDHWKVEAPFEKAWGERGYGRAVPPRADVVLDIELVGFLDLKIETLAEGSGPVPLPGEYVVVHYTAFLPDGKEFDDSRKSATPLVQVMGDGQVIQGWEMTMRRMRVGDRVKVTVPWRLAYGAQGRQGVIPPKADLTYDIERLPLPEIRTEVIHAGDGAKCVPGREILVHSIGCLSNGKQFENTRDPGGKPVAVVLGLHRVLPGWELTIAKMRVGDRWKVTVPWLLAYGTAAHGDVPPKSDLVFDLEVLSMK